MYWLAYVLLTVHVMLSSFTITWVVAYLLVCAGATAGLFVGGALASGKTEDLEMENLYLRAYLRKALGDDLDLD